MLSPKSYASYSLEEIEDKFLKENENYFKAVYFDFAPLWAIPIYQERPTASDDSPIEKTRACSSKECEMLANAVNPTMLVHDRTKTQAVIKPSLITSNNAIDLFELCAYSYDVVRRVDYVAVHGGDGLCRPQSQAAHKAAPHNGCQAL